jgi:hypothetical protein
MTAWSSRSTASESPRRRAARRPTGTRLDALWERAVALSTAQNAAYADLAAAIRSAEPPRRARRDCARAMAT